MHPKMKARLEDYRNRKDKSELPAPAGSACNHRPEPKLGYTQFIHDAENRKLNGENQKWCTHCKSYIWESYWFRSNTKLTDANENRDDVSHLRRVAQH